MSAIRLAGGTVPNEGRLEVNMSGIWGTVCKGIYGGGHVSPTTFPLTTARTNAICSILGYL